MKLNLFTKSLSLLALIGLLGVSSVKAQTNTVTVTNTVTMTNFFTSPLFEFIQQTNLVVVAYSIIDTTSDNIGAGVGIGYKVSDFVVPTLRLDAIDDNLFVPSGNLQLQFPIKIAGKYEAVPFVFQALGTSFNGDNDGEAVSLTGIGMIVKIKANKWYIPDYLLGDYEHWTGGGFNNNQVRLGVGFKLFN